ncbi:MAG: restriction endonuclease subunit S, partial [Desulfovibrio sp.]
KFENIRINSGMVIIRHNASCNIDWLYCALTSHFISRQIKKAAFGSAQPQLTVKIVNGLKVTLPPLPEQEKIAAVLSTWDKAISATDALLANSRQQKKALMQQLLTGKRRLPGFTGEWKVVRAGSVLHEEGARNRGSKITRVLSVTNQKGFVLPEEQFSKRVASDNIENYKIIKRGQFGYNPSRLNVGSFGRLDTFEEGILSPLYVIFSIKDEYIDSDFFLAWMHSGETRQRIKGSTQGSVRESVSFNALASFPLNLPPLDEQRAIAAVLDAADREIVLLEQKAARLREEKKSLMQQLLTGKRRVRL